MLLCVTHCDHVRQSLPLSFCWQYTDKARNPAAPLLVSSHNDPERSVLEETRTSAAGFIPVSFTCSQKGKAAY